MGVGKNHIHACGVIKTTPNNHPSHVGCDTSTQVSDTNAVDLEKTCWNYMGADWRSFGLYILLA